MSAYKNALHVSTTETGPRAQLASELLRSGEQVVVLENVLALRAERDSILCEVIVSPGSSPSSYSSAVASAQALLNNSTLFNAVSGKCFTWLVVDDYGTGTSVLWHGS